MSIITYTPRHANWYDIGRNIYQQGVNSYDAVYVSIRRLGYYLMCGDKDIGLSSVQDNESRTKIIYDIITKRLYWSVERAKQLWKSILDACTWRPPKQRDNQTPNIDSTNSTRVQIVKENSNTIIYSIDPEAEPAKNEPRMTREAFAEIYRRVNGKELVLNKNNPFARVLDILRL